MAIPSYPKSFTLGDSRLGGLFDGSLVIQEKVDGSQIRFGIAPDGLEVWSRGKQQYPGDTDKLFQPAVDSLIERQHLMTPGYAYYGECLTRGKHNTLAYDRTPKGYVVLFDVMANGKLLPPGEVQTHAEWLRLEPVRTLCHYLSPEHVPISPMSIQALLKEESALGGPTIEGIVLKNYAQPHAFGNHSFMVAKYVSEAFKERHDKDWKKRHPTQSDIIETIGAGLCTEARWKKAIQALRDAGTATGTVKDIGPLIYLIQSEIEVEDSAAIADALWEHFRRQLTRRAVKGFAQWYKDQLLNQAFVAAAEESGS